MKRRATFQCPLIESTIKHQSTNYTKTETATTSHEVSETANEHKGKSNIDINKIAYYNVVWYGSTISFLTS